jgi:hypothetical protein
MDNVMCRPVHWVPSVSNFIMGITIINTSVCVCKIVGRPQVRKNVTHAKVCK